jgi:hypothetical protein
VGTVVAGGAALAYQRSDLAYQRCELGQG